MERGFGEVFEDEHHIELLETKLDALQGRNLNIRQGDHKEGRIRQVYKALCGRLKAYVRPEGYSFERQLSEGDVRLQ